MVITTEETATSTGEGTGRLAERAWSLVIARRRIVSLAIYAATAGIAYLTAYLIRFEFDVPAGYVHMALQSVGLLIVVRLGCALFFRLSTRRWRFAGARDTRRLVVSTAVGSVLFMGAARLIFVDPRIPASILLLEAALTVLLTAGVWLAYRSVFDHVRWRASLNDAKRVLIIGAGDAGYTLAQEMMRNPVGYRPIGFLDDNPLKWGTSIDGLEVIGSPTELVAIAAAEKAQEVVIAVPSATPAELRRIVECCEFTGLPFKVLPGLSAALEGKVTLDQLREVRIEDLLGREPIQLELPEVADDLTGSVVLITGAAGSIGSELSRQVALHGPETLVLFDQAETPLFFLDLELRRRFPKLTIVSVIGSVVDSAAVSRVFDRHRPDRVFHAAAYKHVPLMEINRREAVRTNVIGTWQVADAAGRHGAGKFVLVSTDKAVRPVSMMGATKRLAEMVVLALRDEHPDTAFSAVRFGNVLGSNGSVIPIFKQQLAEGRPLTVTHPHATRYFMTIPEAVQLILQSSLLPELRGNIAMLEMGEPVKIVDLARNLLRLSGAEGRLPERESIVFTGLRPGERLHEELVAPDERTSPTPIPKVRLVESRPYASSDLLEQVSGWKWSLDAGDEPGVIGAVERMFGGLAKVHTEHTGTATKETRLEPQLVAG